MQTAIQRSLGQTGWELVNYQARCHLLPIDGLWTENFNGIQPLFIDNDFQNIGIGKKVLGISIAFAPWRNRGSQRELAQGDGRAIGHHSDHRRDVGPRALLVDEEGGRVIFQRLVQERPGLRKLFVRDDALFHEGRCQFCGICDGSLTNKGDGI